jgi:hypothetical protein
MKSHEVKLKKAKNEIANQHKFKSWEGMMVNLRALNTDSIINEVAIRYNELMEQELVMLFNEYMNKLLCSKEIEIESPICSNTISQSIDKFLESKK